MRTLDSVLGWDFRNSVLTIMTPLARVSLEPLARDVIRLTIQASGGRDVFPTGAVVGSLRKRVTSTVTPMDGGVVLTCSDREDDRTTQVRVTFNPLRMEWFENGRLFATDDRIMVSKERIAIHRVLEKDEKFYGLGQKMGFLNRRGKKYQMWATDDPLHTPGTDPMYQSIPFFVGLRGSKAHGFFLDCAARSFFDLGSVEPADTYSVAAESPLFDAYILSNPAMKEIIREYTELTGRMELPPLWALGYHQCRYSYYPEERVREVARQFRQKGIPCDAIWLDIHYMDGYRVFTWAQDRFPRPDLLIKDLAEEGFKTVVIVDPGVKVDPDYAIYQEGLSEDHFIKKSDGPAYQGEVWPGQAVFPDFLREKTRFWWGQKVKEAYLDKGVSGIWLDMNEPANFKRNAEGERTLPRDVFQGEDGRKVQHGDVHNLYGFSMARATYEGLRRYAPDKRPFILTRSGYSGIQRYAAVWMGDNHSWWEHLLASMPICMGMGLSGVPFVGVDVGGFGQDATGELFARWMEVGAFMPFFRGHSAFGTRDQEPWSFGPEVEGVCQKYIRLRYELMPFLYTLFEESSRTGLPVMRPLVLEYQGDDESQTIFDEFMLGQNLLIAPVYFPGQTKRLVYLPKGDWYDFWTGKRVEVQDFFHGKSGRYIVADAPLDTLPVFVKGGAVVPTNPEEMIMKPAKCQSVPTLVLHVYAPGMAEEPYVFELYEDEGDGYGYAQGRFARTKVTVTRDRITVEKPLGAYIPSWKEVRVIPHGFSPSVTVGSFEDGEK